MAGDWIWNPDLGVCSLSQGVPCNHSPKGCCLKLGFRGGQVRYGEAAILHSCKD